MELHGKCALVTGGGDGIGRAIALALAGAGADVAVLDLRPEAAEAVAGEVRALGRRAVALPCNVADAAGVEAAVQRAVAELGGIDILVNNAGLGRPTPSLLDLPESQWDLILSVNLKGPFLVSRAVLPAMLQRGPGGRIINIASLAGRSTSVLMGADYTASKAGLLGLTRHMARELASRSITVNAVCPGTVETPLIRAATPEERQRAEAKVPMGRFAQPEEIASVVLFLASDRSSYMTGASLDVNGGLVMM